MSINETTIPTVVAIPSVMDRETVRPGAQDAAKRFAACAALLAVLIGWAVVFPQTGDGDAIMHYLNAHDSLWQPAKLMGSWARVGSKIHLLIPAQFGVLGARWAAAMVSVLCAWQTIRLADDLKMEHAVLAAPFLIFQPFVFSLAADTMTELPFALGMVIAIRLWMKGRLAASCWVMGYLPTVRPEGFFLCAIWAAMVISRREAEAAGCPGVGDGGLDDRVLGLVGRSDVLLSRGVVLAGGFAASVWARVVFCARKSLAALLRAGVVRFVPGGNLGICAQSGSWLKALLLFGAVCLILELIFPSWIRETILPWAALLLAGAIAWRVRTEKFAVGIWVFLLIFTLHSVLWWRGWFGSCGLMRILACVGPITAIVCLAGWNAVAGRLAEFWRIAAITAIGLTAMVYYVVDPLHQRIFHWKRPANSFPGTICCGMRRSLSSATRWPRRR